MFQRRWQVSGICFGVAFFAWLQVTQCRCQDSSYSVTTQTNTTALSNSLGMEFVHVPEGKCEIEFEYYLPNRAKGIRTFHMPGNCWIGRHEVTVGQFRKFVRQTNYVTDLEKMRIKIENPFDFSGDNGGANRDYYDWSNPGYEFTDEHPVVLVTRNDAHAFCRWLTKRDGRYYRLPSSDEWDYIFTLCAPTPLDQKTFIKLVNFGDQAFVNSMPDSVQNDYEFENGWEGITDGHAMIAPVGSFEADSIGLFDYLGNVMELTNSIEFTTAHLDKDYKTQQVRWEYSHAIRGGCFWFPPSRFTAQEMKAGSLVKGGYRGYVGFRVLAED